MTQNPKISIGTFLETLGTTPEEVAQTLRSMNVTGVRACTQSCIIAQLLTDQFGLLHIAVGRGGVKYTKRLGDEPMFVNMPMVVGEFIIRFDQRYYPDLISKPKDKQ